MKRIIFIGNSLRAFPHRKIVKNSLSVVFLSCLLQLFIARACVLVQLHPFYDRLVGVFFLHF